MCLALEEGHLKGVEEDPRENQRRERTQQGITFLRSDDRVNFESGSENNGKNQDAKEQRGGEVI